MARIRPAKGGGEQGPAGVQAPRGRDKERRSRGRGSNQRRAEKAGTVTKAVQVGRGPRFVSEVATELRKVTWPTRVQLLQATAVVLVFVAIVTAYLAALDEVFGRLVDALF